MNYDDDEYYDDNDSYCFVRPHPSKTGRGVLLCMCVCLSLPVCLFSKLSQKY